MNFKSLLIIPPILLGVGGYIWMTQPNTQPVEAQEAAGLAVRAITVNASPQTLTAEGFGRVEAVRTWSAVSQAEGRVVDVFPDLAAGTIVEAGDLLVQIDPTDYQITVAKSQANIAAAEAALAEIDGQEENTRRLLALETRSYDVAQEEFNRTETLSQTGTVTSASLDAAQRTLLTQENAVTNLQNTLALYPAQRASAEANLAVRQAELAEAERGLANTTIVAPFRGRVSSKAVETGQFVRLGNELLALDAIDAAEVVAAIQPQAFGNLMLAAVGPRLADLAEVDATRVIDYMIESDIAAYVELNFAGDVARYRAQPTRFRGTVDSETGTLGVAVQVDDPLVAAAGDGAPPLAFGSFVSVVFEATPEAQVIAIPRDVVQQDDQGQPFVYTVSADTTLALTTVTPGPVAGDNILILDGLNDGDRVLLSAPRPSVPGVGLEVVDVTEVAQ